MHVKLNFCKLTSNLRYQLIQLDASRQPSRKAANVLHRHRRNIPVIELPDNARYANGSRVFLVRVSPMTDCVRIAAKKPGTLPPLIPSPRTSFPMHTRPDGMPVARFGRFGLALLREKTRDKTGDTK
jgi:hypothetical protein